MHVLEFSTEQRNCFWSWKGVSQDVVTVRGVTMSVLEKQTSTS
jgi:hypothetical protein